jgi:phosphate transport system substrate-binding protein
LDADNYPRVGGSTSTVPLGWLLAAHVWNVPAELRRGQQYQSQSKGAVNLTFPVETTPEEINNFWARMYGHRHSGTHKAYEALAMGQKDLILVARRPSASEAALAQKRNVTLEMRPVALDALVFLVNRKNKVNNLSRLQLESVFLGNTRLWRGVGGTDWPILSLTRNEESGSQELFGTLLLKGRRLPAGEPSTRISSMGGIIDRVAANSNAIGYSVYYFERFMAPRPENKLISIDGIAPTHESIANASYPFVAPVYVVIQGGLPAESLTLRLRDWLLSEPGQKLVAQSGYIPVSPATPAGQ